jgi:hypothetical protein
VAEAVPSTEPTTTPAWPLEMVWAIALSIRFVALRATYSQVLN